MITAENKLTKSQAKKANRDRLYKINTDMMTSIKKMLAPVDSKNLQEILAAYMSILVQKDQEEDVSVDPGTLQQLACLASVTLSRILMERYK